MAHQLLFCLLSNLLFVKAFLPKRNPVYLLSLVYAFYTGRTFGGVKVRARCLTYYLPIHLSYTSEVKSWCGLNAVAVADESYRIERRENSINSFNVSVHPCLSKFAQEGRCIMAC